MTAIDNPSTRSVLAKVFAGRRGLPASAFISEAYFTDEMTLLMHRHWVCIGLARDAAMPGDLHPVEFAGVPLVMARDADGVLRVMHNVCSHRGAMLVDEPQCGAARITCPYHRWMYGLDGALEHTHHIGGFRVHVTPEADPSELGLRPVRSNVWHGFVFVDLSGQAEPFDEYIRPTADRLDVIDFDLVRDDPTLDIDVEVHSNWKTIIENFVESYHVPQVHPELQKFNPMSAHYQILGGAAYAGQGGTAYGSSENPAPMPGDDLPIMQRLADQNFSYESLYVFPNLILVPVENMMFWIMVSPHSAAVTHERVSFAFYTDEAMTEAHRAGREAVVASIVQINNEDIAIVESCQRGRRSPAFVGGVFMTSQEATSLLVQRVFAGRLLEQLGEPIDFSVLPIEDIHHQFAPTQP
ncbi:MAG: aromatic ring-hydroxylating dioxygenase subunit alpha [Ilumatobacteraceae bacterium]